MGVILLRKKLFTQATKNLEKAKKTWNGEPDELAQVLPCTPPGFFGAFGPYHMPLSTYVVNAIVATSMHATPKMPSLLVYMVAALTI